VHPVRADLLNLVRLIHGKDIDVDEVAVGTWPLKATLDILDGLAHGLLDQGGGAGGALLLAVRVMSLLNGLPSVEVPMDEQTDCGK